MNQCNFISQTEVGWDPCRLPSPKPLFEQVAQDHVLSWKEAENELNSLQMTREG